jgi:hypothetical protein
MGTPPVCPVLPLGSVVARGGLGGQVGVRSGRLTAEKDPLTATGSRIGS